MSRPAGADDFYPSVSTRDWGGRATRAEVSLDAIADNVRALQRHARGCKLMAVVKANGYGHGAVPVARAALENGASSVAVYTVDEGIALRQAGIHADILVFGPFERSEAIDLISHGLTPTVTSLEAAQLLADASGDRRIRYHIKVDTGLTRAGVHPGEVVSLVSRLWAMSTLQPEGIYTHFARADEPEDPTTREQVRLFHEIRHKLDEAGFPFPVAHAANSAGALAVPEAWFDVVRVGIAMYGYYPSPDVKGKVILRPALSLHSRVIRVTDILAGTGVGYGHAFRPKRTSRIALVPLGYGDGLNRSLGHGTGTLLIGGHRAPIVGRVSMDQITVDVTDVPSVSSDDPVVLLGRQGEEVQTADDLAARINTINYEILTSIQPRVPRLYTRAGQIVAICRGGRLEYLESSEHRDGSGG